MVRARTDGLELDAFAQLVEVGVKGLAVVAGIGRGLVVLEPRHLATAKREPSKLNNNCAGSGQVSP